MDATEKVLALKRRGDELFVKGSIETAIESYNAAIDLGRDVKEISNAEKSKLLSIRAECLIRVGKMKEAISDCESAIKLDKNNLKAYFRRAKAYESLSLLSKSMADCKVVLNADTDNKAVLDLMRKVQRRMDSARGSALSTGGATLSSLSGKKGGKSGSSSSGRGGSRKKGSSVSKPSDEFEPETSLTWKDQQLIVRYNRLHKEKVEYEDSIAIQTKELDTLKESSETLDMIIDEDTSLISVGNCFWQLTDPDNGNDEIQAFIDEKNTKIRSEIESIKKELHNCINELIPLHSSLKKKFGNHIGLPDIDKQSKYAGIGAR